MGNPIYRIYINGRFLTQRMTGVQRYASAMLYALDGALAQSEAAAQVDFVLLVPPEVTEPPVLDAIRVEKVDGLPGQLWEQITLPAVTRNGYLINFCNRGPAFKAQQMVVIHDAAVAAVPHSFSVLFQASYRALFAALQRSCDCLVTVSHFSRRELGDRLSFSADDIQVVYPGSEHILTIEPDPNVGKFGLKPQRYALLVGSLQPSKNLAAVYEAFGNEKPPFDIAIAGGSNGAIFRHENAHSYAPWIKQLGYVTDAELRGLYENAGCFVFPSLYEGFGLPALEAMRLGCPVVASRAAAIPEVCAEAAVYFDPTDPGSLREAVCKVMSEPLLRETLANHGRARAEMFSWRSAATQIVRLLEDRTNRPIVGEQPYAQYAAPLHVREPITGAETL